MDHLFHLTQQEEISLVIFVPVVTFILGRFFKSKLSVKITAQILSVLVVFIGRYIVSRIKDNPDVKGHVENLQHEVKMLKHKVKTNKVQIG